MFLTLVNVKTKEFLKKHKQSRRTLLEMVKLYYIQELRRELLLLQSENASQFNFMKQKRYGRSQPQQWKTQKSISHFHLGSRVRKEYKNKQTNMVTHSPKWNFTIRGRTPALFAFTMPWIIAFSPPYLTTSLYRQVDVTFICWIKRVQPFTCAWIASSSLMCKVKKTVTLSLKGYFIEGAVSNTEFT